MSRKRLFIFISVVVGLVLALGATGCGGDDEQASDTTEATTETTTTTGGTGERVTIIASVPPTDHGWLGAISKDAQAAADEFR